MEGTKLSLCGGRIREGCPEVRAELSPGAARTRGGGGGASGRSRGTSLHETIAADHRRHAEAAKRLGHEQGGEFLRQKLPGK